MKSNLRFIVAIFVLALCLDLGAETTSTSSAPPPATPDSSSSQTAASDFSQSQIIETWGWIIAHNAQADHSEISDAELPDLLKGISEGFNGARCPYYFGKIQPDIDNLAKARRAKYIQAVTDKNQAIAAALIAELDKNPNVVKLPSGLRYQILQPGSGPCAKPQQTVNVHFLGHLLNGTEITQTGPIDIVLWPNRFNKPVYEALQHLNKGGSMRLYVSSPPTEDELAMYGIQPGSMIVYEIELLDIKETPPDVLADTIVPDAPAPEPPPPSGYSPQQIMETWGWSIARRAPVSQLGFTDDQIALLTKGLLAGIKGQPAPYDLDKIQPDVDKFIADETAKAQEAFKEKQIADNQAFFANLKKNKNVIELPSGLFYEILQPGAGPCAAPGKTVTIAYTGSLLSGRIFDHTVGDDLCKVEITPTPTVWPIAGWNEGLQKINKGGKIKLYIPPSLGFGDDAYNGAPPYSTLIYEIQVLDIQDTPPANDASATTQPTTAPASN
jgi:FKBP-type peptidyl-prolyl cis-trans isomerase